MAITPEISKGRFVTFYSTEGGVGRSLAAYNMAALLAASGERILLIDLDFDKPRLTPELAPNNSRWGALNLFNDLLDDSSTLYQDGTVSDILKERGYLKHIRYSRHRFDFLPAGSSNMQLYLKQLVQFQSRVEMFKVDRLELGVRMKRDLETTYDYVLVDSPTGFSDLVFFTAVHLGDMVVAFTRPGKRSRIGFKTFLEKLGLTFPQQGKKENPLKHLVAVISPVPEPDSPELIQARQDTKKLINKALPKVIDQERQLLELRFNPRLVYGDFPIVRDVLPGSGLDLDYLKLCQTIRSRFDSKMERIK